MPIKNSTELRPGDRVLIPAPTGAHYDGAPLSGEVDRVELLRDGSVLYTVGGQKIAAEEQVRIVLPEPTIFMSFDEETETWAILISTSEEEGQGVARLNIHLNDAELFDGTSDGDDGVIGGR